ncbi:MAG: glycosyltransferase family 4 protein [Candidatus Kryptoniota bacterium]
MKPRIAIVRGPFLSVEEIKLYEPLTDDFDITFVSSNAGTQGKVNNIKIMQASCLSCILDYACFGNAFRKIAGIVNNIAGVDPEMILHLKKILRGFDLVHTIDYDFLITYQIARIKRQNEYKLIATHWENIPFARDNKPIARKMKYYVYSNVDAFFAMSERAKDSLILEGVDEPKIFVTGYGVDTERFRPRDGERLEWRKRYNINQDDVVILFVGRIRQSKGVLELIYAAKKLVQDPEINQEKLKVVIAGKGPMEKELDNRIKLLGLEKNVMRIGYIPHTDIHLVHNMADIFALPSIPRKYWQEQLGLVLLEAMACGKPVVSTLSGSIPEVIGNAGILVQPNDHIALYEALKKIINDSSCRESLGQLGRERVLNNFTVGKISQKMRNGLHQIIGTGRV